MRPFLRFRNLYWGRGWKIILDKHQRLVEHGLLLDTIMYKFLSDTPCQGSVNVETGFTVDMFHLDKTPRNKLSFHPLVPAHI